MTILRRDLTSAYAGAAGLSVSEWRVLSLVAHAGTLPFGLLVQQSTSDKALVSRTVRLLEERDPKVQRAHMEQLVETARDPARARAHLLDSSMIAGLRRSREIQ